MKFLGTLKVIVEAEDWNEAFDFLDELTNTDPALEIAAYGAKIVSSNIEYLRRTGFRSIKDRSSKTRLKEQGMS